MSLKQPLKIYYDVLNSVCSEERGINSNTLEEVIILAIEIAREGREGRKIGTMFVVSDSAEVLKRSKSMILDPLICHPASKKNIGDHNVRETVKELAQLDGAFIISDDGTVISACRYINASSRGIKLPLGLGSRHIAAASITKRTNSVAVIASESSMVRVFDDGKIIGEIIPELWILKYYSLDITEPYPQRSSQRITPVSKKRLKRLMR